MSPRDEDQTPHSAACQKQMGVGHFCNCRASWDGRSTEAEREVLGAGPRPHKPWCLTHRGYPHKFNCTCKDSPSLDNSGEKLDEYAFNVGCTMYGQDVPFQSLLVAAFVRADSKHLARLTWAFPDLADQIITRYAEMGLIVDPDQMKLTEEEK